MKQIDGKVCLISILFHINNNDMNVRETIASQSAMAWYGYQRDSAFFFGVEIVHEIPGMNHPTL